MKELQRKNNNNNNKERKREEKKIQRNRLDWNEVEKKYKWLKCIYKFFFFLHSCVCVVLRARENAQSANVNASACVRVHIYMGTSEWTVALCTHFQSLSFDRSFLEY